MASVRITFSFWNEKGERFWFKWHFKSQQGIENLSNSEAAAAVPFGAQQDLVKAINDEDFPRWTAKVQIMSEEQARDYSINPFDLTKVWPHADFPLIEVGQLELNTNVENYFAETEQAAFAPSNLVPGIGPSPDKMLQGRLLAYQDAHRYRIGANANQLPVNAARCPVNHYQRDGAMAGMCPAHGGNKSQGAGVNFFPNDGINEGAAVPQPSVMEEPPMPVLENAWIKPYDSSADDHYSQAGDLFRLMDDSQKNQLAANIADGLMHATDSARERLLKQFAEADPDYASRVGAALSA